MSRNDDMQFYTEIKLVVMNFRTLYNGFIVIGNTSTRASPKVFSYKCSVEYTV